MENFFEYMIVGSGPGAVMAAQTLTEAGKEVLMADVGFTDNIYSTLTPEKVFGELRKSDKTQHRYFLGDEFEAIPKHGIKTGAQLTPARLHIIKGTDNLSPLVSDSFFPMESFALGGLGAGWGLGAYVYSPAELEKAGLPADKMEQAYNTIASRIGISCGNDDVAPYLRGSLENVQPPLKADNSIESMMMKYNKKRSCFLKRNIYFGLPSMAILTQDKDDRKATSYFDMDFYSDPAKAAWRPAYTVEKLLKNKNFSYRKGLYITHFIEKQKERIKVFAKDINTGEQYEFSTSKLLLGAGALGTARIALRSLDINSLPLLSNPYTYMPAINIKMLGKTLSEYKTSMAQAMMIYDPDGSGKELVSVALFTYRSLLLMRLIQQSPLNISDNRKIFKLLQPAFVIAGIHHPDEYYKEKRLRLIPYEKSLTGDALKADFDISKEAAKKIRDREKVIKKALKFMGVYPIKRINPGFGASIHYGGTLPFSEGEKEGTSSPDGRLNGTRGVYAVDGSSFRYLPAKGITLSIMANAHRVARNILNND